MRWKSSQYLDLRDTNQLLSKGSLAVSDLKSENENVGPDDWIHKRVPVRRGSVEYGAQSVLRRGSHRLDHHRSDRRQASLQLLRFRLVYLAGSCPRIQLEIGQVRKMGRRHRCHRRLRQTIRSQGNGGSLKTEYQSSFFCMILYPDNFQPTKYLNK